MTGSVRAALTVALLAAFFLTFALVVALLAVLTALVARSRPDLALKVAAVSALATYGLVRTVLALNRRGPDGDDWGVEVPPAAAPALWAAVLEITASAQIRPPGELRLTPEAEVAVVEGGRWLALRPGTRWLLVGMPLLQVLSEAELRAVLARELGRESPAGVRLGGLVYRCRTAIRRADGYLGDRPVTRRALACLGWLYDAVAWPVLRTQERRAAELAASVAGAAVASGAVVVSRAAAATWDRYLDGHVRVGWRAGYVPDDLFGGFGEVMAAAAGPGPASDRTLDRAVGWCPAVELLGDPTEVRRRLVTFMFGPDLGGRQLLPWPELMHRAAAAEAAAAGKRLLRETGRVLATAPARLGHVLDLLEAGRGDELAARLAAPDASGLGGMAATGPGAPGRAAAGRATRLAGPGLATDGDHAAGRRAVARGLEQLVGHALAGSGRGRWALRWEGPAELTGPDGTCLGLTARIEAAVADPDAVPELRGHLDALGIRADLHLDAPRVRS